MAPLSLSALRPLAVAALATCALSAQAGVLYGINNAELFRIDGSNGSATKVGDMLPAGTTSSFVFDLAGGGNNLWGLVLEAPLPGTSISTTRLVQIDTNTAALTYLPTISVPLPGRRIDTIAFDASTGTMYGISNTFTRTLYTIDLVTGAATLVGATGGSTDYLYRSLTMVGGDLYAAPFSTPTDPADTKSQLQRIDKSTGAAVAVSTLISGQIADLAWDPDTDVLYGGTFLDDGTGASLGAQLVAIDRNTAATTVVGTYAPGGSWVGLAVLDGGTVPEPSTMLLVAAAAGALLRRGRR